MGLQPLIDIGSPCVARGYTQGDLGVSLDQQHIQPQTPPGSTSGSPRIKIEGLCSDNPRDHTPLPRLLHLNSPRKNSVSQVRLPSLEEFDQGVEELARIHGPVNSWTPPSPLPSLTRSGSLLETLQPMTPPRSSLTIKGRPFEDPASGYFSARRGTITSLSQYALAIGQEMETVKWQTAQYHSSPDNYHHGLSSPLQGYGMDSYPSPPPEGENRHINQKYTTEQGDFIIYAWHDRKMKWQRIKQEFANMFGREPVRTVQGLQAWYYRMNQKIPIWDKDGWLCFDNEEDLEPKQISIKCRERDSHDKPMEPLGLAQRYPERAINYTWVDPELKHKARDWAAKRALQYHERRERRRKKEQRRMKL
ncbi:Fc.00g111770.m01.CDS01 [Cosmosporella sp. VM-42]